MYSHFIGDREHVPVGALLLSHWDLRTACLSIITPFRTESSAHAGEGPDENVEQWRLLSRPHTAHPVNPSLIWNGIHLRSYNKDVGQCWICCPHVPSHVSSGENADVRLGRLVNKKDDATESFTDKLTLWWVSWSAGWKCPVRVWLLIWFISWMEWFRKELRAQKNRWRQCVNREEQTRADSSSVFVLRTSSFSLHTKLLQCPSVWFVTTWTKGWSRHISADTKSFGLKLLIVDTLSSNWSGLNQSRN